MRKQQYIDVSLDFDFFFWDDPHWDWAHQETVFFLEAIWAIREQGMSVYGKSLETESTLGRADFGPTKLVEVLASKGLQVGKWTKVSIAESHADQYALSLKSRRNLVMFDAHTDIWAHDDVNCASWLWLLLKNHSIKHATVVIPSWQDWYRAVPEPEHTQLANCIDIMKWNKYPGSSPVKVANLFICRSGCWVPPHHDELFREMVLKILGITSKFYRRGMVDPLCPRRVDYKKVRYTQEQRNAILSLNQN